MLLVFSLVLLILAIFLDVRHAEAGNVCQLVEEVALEPSHDQCNSKKHNDDQSNKKGFVVKSGLGDVGEVQGNIRN